MSLRIRKSQNTEGVEVGESTGPVTRGQGLTHNHSTDAHLAYIQRYPVLDRKRVFELGTLAQGGDEAARQELVLTHLRLVPVIAGEYYGIVDMPFEDLIQEGNAGLMRAVESYDIRKGALMTTYGSWWIRQSIRKSMAKQGRTIGLKAGVIQHILEVRKAQSELTQKLGHEPSELEVRKSLGNPSWFFDTISAMRQFIVSLHANVGHSDNEDFTVGDMVSDTRSLDPEQIVEARELLHEIAGDIKSLAEYVSTKPARDRTVFYKRYGLHGHGPGLTLERVAMDYGITRERVRQVCAFIWRRMPPRIKIRTERFFFSRLMHVRDLQDMLGETVDLRPAIHWLNDK